MAREMALAGVPKEELERVETPPEPQTPKSKWQNFWFYYKWWVIAGACLVAIIVIGMWQMLSRVEPDYPIALVTRDGVPEDAIKQLEDLLESYGEDLNGDGKVIVEIENLPLAQYVGGRKNPMAETNSQKIMAYLMSSDVMFYIFDEPSYKNYAMKLKESGDVETLFDTLDGKFAGVNTDENYWDWAEDSRRCVAWGGDFPEHLYFGVRHFGGKVAGETAKARHDNDMALLQAILEDKKDT